MRDAVEPRALAILEDAKRWTGGKQRLTAARLHELLRSEGHDVGYTVVKDIVVEWKRRRKEVFVPLVYKAGDLGERTARVRQALSSPTRACGLLLLPVIRT